MIAIFINYPANQIASVHPTSTTDTHNQKVRAKVLIFLKKKSQLRKKNYAKMI
jgi:hypothetical protein